MNIIQDVIKKGGVNRPQAANSCEFITIHETGNTNAGADAAAHSRYVKSLNERTSWHYTVDDSSVYQHIPDNEKSYHTSNATANESSIAIELCVNSDGDFAKTLKNAAELVRYLRGKYNIPVANIRTHKDWTGKNCPATLLKSGWNEFLRSCDDSVAAEEKKCITVAELRAMGYASIAL